MSVREITRTHTSNEHTEGPQERGAPRCYQKAGRTVHRAPGSADKTVNVQASEWHEADLARTQDNTEPNAVPSGPKGNDV